jgi:hypothetical protein
MLTWSMMTSAGTTADINKTDSPGDVMMTSCCHHDVVIMLMWHALVLPHVTSVISFFDNHLLIPENALT